MGDEDKKNIGKTRLKFIMIIAILVFVARVIYVFYPMDLGETAGIQGLTAEDISSIYFQQSITVPKDMNMEKKGITMENIGKKLDGMESLPLWNYRESYYIDLPDIRDKDFIEEILSLLSHHTMRKTRGGASFSINNAMPDSTLLFMRLIDDHKPQIHMIINHDPRYISISKFGSSVEGNSVTRHYKLYGEGIDTQRLFDLAREF